MYTFTAEIVKDVAQGNPGALTVIDKLQWFSNWEEMLAYLKKKDLVGPKLWEKVSDQYKLNFDAFGKDIEEEMLLESIERAKKEEKDGTIEEDISLFNIR